MKLPRGWYPKDTNIAGLPEFAKHLQMPYKTFYRWFTNPRSAFHAHKMEDGPPGEEVIAPCSPERFATHTMSLDAGKENINKIKTASRQTSDGNLLRGPRQSKQFIKSKTDQSSGSVR